MPLGDREDGQRSSPVLVGRDDLLALAVRRLDAARDGSGELLLLAGEAGIGKTRLLTEVCTRAAERDVTVVTVGAYPRDVEAAGGLLADLATVLRRGTAPAAGQRIAQRLRASGTTDGDAYRQRRLLVADLADLVVSLGDGTRPVLLALEDLHWADGVTLDVLDRVAHRLGSARMLVVATYRSDELYPRVPMRAWRARLVTQRLAEEARLPRLDAQATAAMAAAIAGALLPVALTEAVHRRSDGIPLHIEEFLPILAAPGDTHAAIPDTLAEAVLARAAELSAQARAVAQAGAVIGQSFDLDLLTAITGESPEGIDTALRELRERFFIQRSGEEAVYDFRHALIRDALYGDLAPHHCRQLHARVAEAARAAGFGDAFVSAQYERANQPGPAYRHALAAAAEAVALSAHREAVELYRRAQRTAPGDLPTADRAELLAALAGELAATDDNARALGAYAEAYRLRREAGDRMGAAGLVPAMVAARHLLGAGLEERVGLLTEALSLVEPGPEPVPPEEADVRLHILAGLAAAYMLDRRLEKSMGYGREAQALSGGARGAATRLNADTTLGAVLTFAGQPDEGWELLETAVGEARDAHLEAEAARAYRMIGSSASVLVEYPRARRFLLEGIGYAERTERLNDRHYMAAHLGHVEWATGDWVAATATATQAHIDSGDGVTTRIIALHVLGYLALGRADWALAERHLQEARKLGEQMSELQRLSPALWGLAEVALRAGRVAEALDGCERGYAASAAVRDAAYLFPYLVTGARAYLATDDLSGARDWVDRCADLVGARAIPGTLPAIDHARGLLHLADGHTGRARDRLAAASAGWDQRGRFWEGTQALIDRAEAARRSRRPTEAATLLAEADRRIAATGATALRGAADAIRSGAPAPAAAAALSAREAEVARLIATGATNREIAAALYISPKTVAAHVEHILAKLGAARRAEIAAWVTAHLSGTPQ